MPENVRVNLELACLFRDEQNVLIDFPGGIIIMLVKIFGENIRLSGMILNVHDAHLIRNRA
jgi:hypothetical protein